MKICIAASAGGHLTEVMQLSNVWKDKAHFFVSDSRAKTIFSVGKERVCFVEVPARSPLKLLRNIIQSIRIFFKERPDVVISTGADVAVPFCIIAKFFGKKVVFIESFCRTRTPSLSGKIMYGKADLFLVQWKQNLEFFPKAKYAGAVF